MISFVFSQEHWRRTSEETAILDKSKGLIPDTDTPETEEDRMGVEKALIPKAARPSLPIDMLFDILILLPLKSLLRLKCVCKEWLSLIENWHFITKHSERGPPVTYSVEEIPRMQILCHKDGLLIEKDMSTRKVRLRNPFTRQVLDLPDSLWGGSYEIIYQNLSTGTCKIVSMKDWNSGFITLGTRFRSWRILEALKAPNASQGNDTNSVSHIFTGDALHYINRVSRGGSISEIEVVSVDIETETITRTSLPDGFFSNLDNVGDSICYGYLAFTCVIEENLNVIVLKDHRSSRWCDEIIVIPVTFIKRYPNMEFLQFVGDEMKFRSADKNIDVWYNVKTGVVRKTNARKRKTSCVMQPSLLTFRGVHLRAKPQSWFRDLASEVPNIIKSFLGRNG